MGLDRGSGDLDGASGETSALQCAQREIARLRAEVAALSADRAQWLTVLAHELRTPLTVICGYNRLLLAGEAGPLTEEQARFLGESTRSCQRLDRFISTLLDGVHDGFLEKGLELAPNDVDRVVADVCRLLRPLVDAKGLQTIVEIDPDARRARFDTTRIEQVVTNLLGNAVRYTKPGGTLRILGRRVSEGGADVVAISVVDQGPGIAPVDRGRVFDPFVRLAGPESGEGLGLGLTICRRIVAAHGGTIGVAAEPDGGSRFTFTLPAAEPAGGAS